MFVGAMMAIGQSLVSTAAQVGLSVLGRARRARTRGALRLPGLTAPVEILRDRWGVPHIYATSTLDLMFAQGFVHAQDRLWQMEFQRRLVAGRLAEVVGPAALPTDRAVRILGMRRVAEAEVALLDPEARAELDAYVAGVNACTAREPLPVEFTLLRYRPEPWTAADSLSWAKMMAWSLSGNWESELLRTALIEQLGPELAAELEPPSPASWPTVLGPDGAGRLEVTATITKSAYADSTSDADLDLDSRRRSASQRLPRFPTAGADADLPSPAAVPGSNNWVVAGWRSATGMPLLANDMHLRLSIPAIWYENHLIIVSQAERAERSRRTVPSPQSEQARRPGGGADPSTALRSAQDDQRMPLRSAQGDQRMPLRSAQDDQRMPLRSAQDDPATLNVTGVTFPGVPGVVAGHNGHVAWGFTNGYPDVQDLYMERLRRTDDGRVQYEYCGEWLDAEVRREIIQVKGGEPVTEEVIATRHGPIINALAPGLAAPTPIPPDFHTDAGGVPSPLAHALALRWTALDPAPMLAALRAMNRARTCAEFREALRGWAAPVQNTVYADTQGNIAYSYPGLVPIRARGQGRVPVPGWDGEHEWLGYVPFDELPHLLNPPQGFIASANNRIADTFPHFLGSEFATGERAQRIVTRLKDQPKADVAFFQQMQQEQISPTMQTIAGYLGGLRPADPDLAAAVEVVRRWDGRLTADSPAAAICEVCGRALMQVILQHRLGSTEADHDLATRYLGKGPTPILAEASFMSQRSWEWLLHILTLPHSYWFDLGGGERRDDVLLIALRQTLAYLRGRLGPPGPSLQNWAWGRLHMLTLGHMAGRVPAMARHFNRGPFPLGGDGNTIWAAGNGLTPETSTATVGPPFRFIADLADLNHCWGTLIPGNSGRPDSPHYDNQIDAWFKGEYHPMLYAREDVEWGAMARLRLDSCPPKSSHLSL